MNTFTVYLSNCTYIATDCADAMEAAQCAVEVFYGLRQGAFTMFPDCASNETPRLSPLLLVYASGDSDRAFMVQTHVCLASAGLIREASAMKVALDEQMQVANC